MKKKAFYAQSGGVTSVINTTACGLIETAKKHNIQVYAGRNGILGALNEDLIDTNKEPIGNIANLRNIPGGAFGSCRYKLKNPEEEITECKRIIDVFEAHNIGYFFYNGGGDSQDTIQKISKASEIIGYPLVCIGIPKTIDNDIPFTDNCPGFGSTAKYIATSIREIGYDLKSMASSSTQIFVLEVMGRHSGWIAAASGLSYESPGDAPNVILFPEVIFDEKKFLNTVAKSVRRYGYCSIVTSEGIKNKNGTFIADVGCTDAFGNLQLGGVAPIISKIIKKKLGYKYHWAVSDYLQRSARHLSSKTDLEQAYSLGEAAIEYAIKKDQNNIMLIIIRKSNKPYRWEIGTISLDKVANAEKKLPSNFITKEGFHITKACRKYILPLIQGEETPPFKNGLPYFTTLKNYSVKPKLQKHLS